MNQQLVVVCFIETGAIAVHILEAFFQFLGQGNIMAILYLDKTATGCIQFRQQFLQVDYSVLVELE